MKMACQNLTTSRVTSSDMGTKFLINFLKEQPYVKMRIHVPVVLIQTNQKLLSHGFASLIIICRYTSVFCLFMMSQVLP